MAELTTRITEFVNNTPAGGPGFGGRGFGGPGRHGDDDATDATTDTTVDTPATTDTVGS